MLFLDLKYKKGSTLNFTGSKALFWQISDVHGCTERKNEWEVPHWTRAKYSLYHYINWMLDLSINLWANRVRNLMYCILLRELYCLEHGIYPDGTLPDRTGQTGTKQEKNISYAAP